MLTAWAKKMIPFFAGSLNNAFSILPSFNGTAYTVSPGVIEGKDYQGNTKYFLPYMNWDKSKINTLGASSKGFAFGTGTTPATENDYTIESIISSGLNATFNPPNYTGANTNYNSEDDEMSLSIDITLTNSTQSSITISEICRFGTAYFSATKGANSEGNSVSALIDRVVLDNPITIPATESVVVRYETIIPLS